MFTNLVSVISASMTEVSLFSEAMYLYGMDDVVAHVGSYRYLNLKPVNNQSPIYNSYTVIIWPKK